jgi:hypothetical protein
MNKTKLLPTMPKIIPPQSTISDLNQILFMKFMDAEQERDYLKKQFE